MRLQVVGIPDQLTDDAPCEYLCKLSARGWPIERGGVAYVDYHAELGTRGEAALCFSLGFSRFGAGRPDP